MRRRVRERDGGRAIEKANCQKKKKKKNGYLFFPLSDAASPLSQVSRPLFPLQFIRNKLYKKKHSRLTGCCFLSGASRNAEGERREGEAIATRCIAGKRKRTTLLGGGAASWKVRRQASKQASEQKTQYDKRAREREWGSEGGKKQRRRRKKAGKTKSKDEFVKKVEFFFCSFFRSLFLSLFLLHHLLHLHHLHLLLPPPPPLNKNQL